MSNFFKVMFGLLAYFAWVLVMVGIMTYSDLANAHVHYPSTYGGKNNLDEAYRYSVDATVPITVGNANEYPQAYRLYVNNNLVGTTHMLQPGEMVAVDMPISFAKQATVEKFKLCSVGIPNQNTNFSYRICTYAKLAYINL